jgi:HlyD family secretion protein
MNISPPIFLSIGVLLIAGIILLWWLTGRIGRKGIRRFIRIVVLPAYAIDLVVIGMITMRSQTSSLPQTQAIASVTETMTVKLGTLTQSLNATGSIAAADNTVLNFKTSAPVTEVLVKVGDQVQAGDTLAHAETTALDVQVRKAQISLTQAQNSLNELTAKPRDIDIKIAKADIQAAQASLSSASETGSSDNDVQIAKYKEEIAKNQLWQAQLNRDMSNDKSNPNAQNAYSSQIQSDSSLAQSQTSIDIAGANYDSTASNGPNQSSLGSANAQLVSAQASLDSLLAGPNDKEVRQAQIAVETAQITLDAAKQAVEDATLKAPFSGVVAEVNIVPGEVPPETGAITLLDTSHFSTTLSVDEKDISQLQVGQTVNLNVKAFNGGTTPATVTRIEPAPKSSSGLVTYNVEVTLNTVDPELRPGMTTIANVVLGQQDNVIVVPNRFITTDSATQKTTAKVQMAPNVYTDIPVTIGAHSDSESVITNGVSVGQTLVILAANTSPTGNFGLFPGGGGGAPPGGGDGGGFPGGGGGAPPSGGGGAPPGGGAP